MYSDLIVVHGWFIHTPLDPYVMDRDAWSGKFTLKESNNKYTIAVSYLRLITYKNITIIKYKSYRRDKTNEAKGGK